MSDPAQVDAGQAVYTPGVLRWYDFIVHRVSNPLIWRCATRRLIDFTNAHITDNHLDLGVGTGLLLDRANLPADSRIVLVDLNQNCLEATSRRIARYHPDCYRRNVLAPLDIPEEPFTSAGLHYLLHCLPGHMREKSVVFDHVAEYLEPGGVLFGSTILNGGVRCGATAKALMRYYNRQGIFSNAADTRNGLIAALKKRFQEGDVETVGCVSLFWARKPW